jgi:hypothetical protein
VIFPRWKRWPGARVVTLNPPRRGKRKPEYLQWLAALAQAKRMATRWRCI